MIKIQRRIDSIIGPLYLVASETALLGVFWKKQLALKEDKSKENKILNDTEKQIHEYLGGRRTTFDLPLALEGTSFQKRVWSELQKIPYGKTKSYKEIAAKLKNHKAARAVGTANGKNPLCIIVPCHRVINENGNLGGYSDALLTKKKLLELEGLN